MTGRDLPPAAAPQATAPIDPGIRWGHWLGTVGVQGVGALATLSVGLLIAAAQGPEAQGRYGVVRSTADLLLALGLCGLPQGIVHVLNHLRVAPARVERWMLRYLALLLLLAAGMLAGAALIGADPLGAVELAGSRDANGVPPAAANTAAAAHAGGAGALLPALAVGVLGWVVHGLQRVFVLCRDSTPRFSWLSVAPALTLLAAVGLLAWTGSQRYEQAVAFSGLASAACGALAMRRLRSADGWRQRPLDDSAAAASAPSTARWTALLRPSLHALVQTAALALQPWVALQLLLRQALPGSHEVGWFVFAGHVAQAFALPATFVAPLVFARASQAAGLDRRPRGAAAARSAAARRPIRTVGWITCGVALAAAVVLPHAVPALFGAAYAGASGACAALALAGPALVIGRLHTALLLGEGHFAAVTVLFALRAALVPAFTLAAWRWTPLGAASGAAAGWALAEAVICLAQAALRTRRDRQSPPSTR